MNTKIEITNQIISMLHNNIVLRNGNETFVGWCENGDMFRTTYPNQTEEWYNEMETLMNEVAPLIDKLTYDHLTN